jgi:nitroreductase
VTDHSPASTDFFDVVTRQRACREFAPKPVDDDDIAAVLTAATHAPSAENKQPWEFVVVRNDDTRAAIAELTKRGWEAVGREWSRGRLTPKMFAEVDRAQSEGYVSAPVLIAVCSDTQRGLEQTIPSSIFPAVQNLLLAATARGLGSALTTIAASYRAELSALLDLPPHVVPVAVVPLGHPARPLGRPRRDPFESHTHAERYGSPWK